MCVEISQSSAAIVYQDWAGPNRGLRAAKLSQSLGTPCLYSNGGTQILVPTLLIRAKYLCSKITLLKMAWYKDVPAPSSYLGRFNQVRGNLCIQTNNNSANGKGIGEPL